jgi:hypothetical protein
MKNSSFAHKHGFSFFEQFNWIDIFKRMLNMQILQSIECAAVHKWSKLADGTKWCAKCKIGYKMIACEPLTLACGHHVCKECGIVIRNRILKCRFCARKVELTGGRGTAADSLFQFVANDLAKQL